MGRKTKMNSITSPELLAQVNPENTQLLEDFKDYLRSIQRSETTIAGYENDIQIAFVWCLQHNNNTFFVNWTKRNIVAYQNWLLNSNENSPARIRRLKAALSSMSNFIESVLDDEFPNFRNIINKVENPVNRPVREKTVWEDSELEALLEKLVERKDYEKACYLALAMYSGRRKSELCRFKISDFDVWRNRRLDKYGDSEWLFPDAKHPEEHIQISTINSWSNTFSRLSGKPAYIHSLRHYFTTSLAKAGIPDGVIQSIVAWESSDMVQLYKDIDADEQIGMYFKDGDIVAPEQKGLGDL